MRFLPKFLGLALLSLAAGVTAAPNYVYKVATPGVTSAAQAPAQAPAEQTDPLFGNVTFLLHMDGTAGSTSFTDVKGHTVTASGNAQLSGTGKYGSGAATFDGAGDYLTVTDPSGDLNFGTNDFTVEGWFLVRNTTSGYKRLFNNAPGTAGGGRFYVYANSTNLHLYDNQLILTTIGSFTGNTWFHLAVSRQSGTLRTFVNGTLASTFADTSPINSPNSRFYLGGGPDTEFSDVSIDEFRVTKGVARYTASFTPPTAAFPNN